MRKYETIIILKPDLPENSIGTLVKKIDKVVGAKPGEIVKKDDWGLHKLAYEIAKQKKGRYLFWSYIQPSETIRTLDRLLRFDEGIVRQLTVVVAEEVGKEDKKAAPKKVEKPAPVAD